MRQEIISWDEVETLIDHLINQLHTEYDAILAISPSGVIPGGLLSAATGTENILTSQVEFPPEADEDKAKLFLWPNFLTFPEPAHLEHKNILIVNNAWGAGRTTRAVQKRVEALGGHTCTCVLHYNPYRNLLKVQPDFYGAITDAYIIYPWEIDRDGPDRVLLENGGGRG
jgi:hypothetical protein